MAYQPMRLDVMMVLDERKMAHASHPTEATTPIPAHIAAAIKAEDVLACIGHAQLTEEGKLFIQLKAFPRNGRLIIDLPK